ncbi:hypothetical protein D3C76_1429420 [compost metagenome]|uniref:hypothetical protein n=1 Tax=Paenibacillus TaxID=44249 RepID=UPI000FA06019|nr:MULTISPECIES: hypothetical protein [Paenibacillus]MDH6430635.1 2,4-dienoyl-CoA reductase-like NADH-dependent reductase (Old Yellow Enzyme family) [Paenibacillus sp. PastH-4]MDH6527527.1 2,4-dienoyl-CoA reductase-like NADH-dependent reductase (Old Yellow Enzyme family) [Paenibacillus sp. PastH-3]
MLDILNSGITLVAMGREFIVEPHWVKKVMDGNEGDIAWEKLFFIEGWVPVAKKMNRVV